MLVESIENQIERFAPGFRDVVLDRHVMTAQNWPAYNPNLVGGDISGGLQELGQMWQRPLDWRDPYRLPADGLFLCSASTPPGGGVHGLCGYHAARSVLRHCGCQEFTLAGFETCSFKDGKRKWVPTEIKISFQLEVPPAMAGQRRVVFSRHRSTHSAPGS